jgi:hypothetical protein
MGEADAMTDKKESNEEGKLSSQVYHYTNTARLPWIITAGELRPGANRLGGYPDPEFVWATTDPRGSRTAAGGNNRAYREGELFLVRFTLNADDFEPWSGIGLRYPTWTPDQIARLEQSGRRRGDNPGTWRCRAEPLPLGKDIAVGTRTYNNSHWRPWNEPTLIAASDSDDTIGVVVDGVAFISKKMTTGAYAVTKCAPDAFNIERVIDF